MPARYALSGFDQIPTFVRTPLYFHNIQYEPHDEQCIHK